MSAEHSEITDRRKLTVNRTGGAIEWTVNEFNHGDTYILTASSANAGLNVSTHFGAEEWADFQTLITGGQS